MGFLIMVVNFLSFCYISFGPETTVSSTFDVTSYGAIGDGITDDSEVNNVYKFEFKENVAFVEAWEDLCGDTSSDPTLIIPTAMTFLLTPVAFEGPCESPTVNIKLLGNMTAPMTLDGWKDCRRNRFWIYFQSVQGLTIDGPGQMDGQGSIWWGNKAATETCDRPSALHFSKCDGLRLNGTTHINSPMLHISINGCEDVDVGNLQILAPGNSPNTDGIDISSSSHVNIHDSTIQTGDDCVAINGGILDLNVTRVLCGPGHGISIGSLGENGDYDTVEQVRVENCNITGTTNGLRIKTVPNGSGYARGIVYQDILLENVSNPIIIDQHYCFSSFENNCSGPPTTDVQVSDVKYINIHGSSATKKAINFNCSDILNCTGIVTNQVEITGDDSFAYCENTQGTFGATSPEITCD